MTRAPDRRPLRASGLILAGGASSRFGRSKPLAELRGRALVGWVAAALAPRCGEILLSIGIRDDDRAFRRAVPGARLVRDLRGERGPIEGFRRGFRAARGEVVLVAPGDAPLLQPSLHGALLGVLGEHEAAVPRARAMDPVRGAYRRDAVLRVLRREGDRIRSPSALVDRLDAVLLEGDALLQADPALASFIDVNRREDLARAIRMEPARP